MNKFFIPCAVLIMAVVTSCDKATPPNEPDDSCLWDLSVRHSVTISLNVDDSMEPYKEVTYDEDAKEGSRNGDPSYARRYVVYVFRAGTNQLVASAYSSSPTLDIQLPVGKLDVVGWADYSLPGSAMDEFFLTDDISELIVASKHPYVANNHFKHASWGKKSTTVAYNTKYVDVELSSVMSQLRIIATDTPNNDVAQISISYPERVPCAIDGISGVVCYSWSGVWFESAPVHLNIGETLLGYDNVPCNDSEMIVPVRIVMTSNDGKVIARCLRVDAPLKRGGITEVRGPFYSILQSDDPQEGGTTGGGVSIDPSFDDEIVIIIK